MKVVLRTDYSVVSETVIELPPGKTWGNVVSHHIKHQRLTLDFDDGTTLIADENEPFPDDFKFPYSYSVYSEHYDAGDEPLLEFVVET